MDEDDDAVALWRAKTRSLGWSASAWEGLGRTLALVDDTRGAAACFSLAVALRPSEGQAAYESLAALSTWSREATAAFARSVCDVAPTVLWAWRALAALSCDEEAVKALQSALRCDPEDASSWQALGLAYERLAKLPAARRALSRAVELAPESEEAGMALCGLLDSQAAEEAAAVAHQRQPTALWAARLLAESARCRGAPEEALPALRSLLRSAPKDAATWEVLAAAYARSRKPKAAYAAAVQALSCEHATSGLPLAYAASLSALLTLGLLPPHESCAAAERACAAAPASLGCHVLRSRSAYVSAQQARRLGDKHAVNQQLETAACKARAGGGGLVACKALGDGLLVNDCSPVPPKLLGARRAFSAALHWRPNLSSSWADFALSASRTRVPSRAVLRAAEAALCVRPRASSADAWSVHAAVVLRGAVPPVGGDFSISADAAAAAESSLSHAAHQGGESGAAAAISLARLYIMRAVAAAGEGAREDVLSAAHACLQFARAQPGGGVSDSSAWLATALLDALAATGLESAVRGDKLALLAALQAAAAEGSEPEADARLSAALLAQSEPLTRAALAPACRAAAWRPACWRSASAVAGALHARGLHRAAAISYAAAARLAGEPAVAAHLEDASSACDAAAHGEQAAAERLVAMVPLAAVLFSRAPPSSPFSARITHALPSLPLAYAREARTVCTAELGEHSTVAALALALHRGAASWLSIRV